MSWTWIDIDELSTKQETFGTSYIKFRNDLYYLKTVIEGQVQARSLTIPYCRTAEEGTIIIDGYTLDSDYSITIESGSIHAFAPPGTALSIDILKDSIRQYRLLGLPAATKDYSTDITDITFAAGEKFGLKMIDVGSPEPGEISCIILQMKVTS